MSLWFESLVKRFGHLPANNVSHDKFDAIARSLATNQDRRGLVKGAVALAVSFAVPRVIFPRRVDAATTCDAGRIRRCQDRCQIAYGAAAAACGFVPSIVRKVTCEMPALLAYMECKVACNPCTPPDACYESAGGICCSYFGDAGIDALGKPFCCPQGSKVCGGRCQDIESDGNCGVCGRVCARNEHCENKLCRPGCRAGQTLCDNRCVSTRFSDKHCGTCGNECVKNATCGGGACFCGSITGPQTSDATFKCCPQVGSSAAHLIGASEICCGPGSCTPPSTCATDLPLGPRCVVPGIPRLM